jgi:hypothetical protein
VYSLMPLLKKNIFHRTNINGFKGIRQSGYILPNSGQFPSSYPQSKSYFGPSMGYICLFDFESSREEDYRINHHIWGMFFADQKPVTIVLKLNRHDLQDKLFPNSVAPKLGEENYKGFISFVEAWYPEAIPVSAIEGYIVTYYESFEIKFIEFSKDESQEFDDFIAQFTSLSTSS